MNAAHQGPFPHMEVEACSPLLPPGPWPDPRPWTEELHRSHTHRLWPLPRDPSLPKGRLRASSRQAEPSLGPAHTAWRPGRGLTSEKLRLGGTAAWPGSHGTWRQPGPGPAPQPLCQQQLCPARRVSVGHGSLGWHLPRWLRTHLPVCPARPTPQPPLPGSRVHTCLLTTQPEPGPARPPGRVMSLLNFRGLSPLPLPVPLPMAPGEG